MKLTGGLAAVFFATSIYLGHLDAIAMQQTTMQLPANRTNSILIPGEKNTDTVRKSKTTVPADSNTEKK
jgi:hypothetical protein